MEFFGEIFGQAWALLVIVVFFGGSIFVHELGHFLAAKWRGLKIERFSIGFGPKLFSWRGKDGCDYRVSLLPLGGYVALPQLADMGALEGGPSQSKEAHAPLSFFDKFTVSAAGAFFNLVFAALLACVVWVIGIPTSSQTRTDVIGAVPQFIHTLEGDKIPNPAYIAGLRAGDRVLKIDSKNIGDFSQILEAVALGSMRDKDGKPLCAFTVERDGKVLELYARPVLYRMNLQTGDDMRMLGLTPAMRLKVASVAKGSAAESAGIIEGDVITRLEGKKVYSNVQVSERISALSEGEGVELTLLRGAEEIRVMAFPKKIYKTKPLCIVSLGVGEGRVEFLVKTDARNAGVVNSVDARGEIIVYKADRSDPRLEDIRAEDVLRRVGDREISTVMQLATLVNRAVESGPCVMTLTDLNGMIKSVTLPSSTNADILPAAEAMILGCIFSDDPVVIHPSVLKQFSDAIGRTYDALSSLVNPQSDVGINQLAGPVDIVRLMHRLSFFHISMILSFVVLLNVNLAILNLLPIPVLDGGHIMFAAIAKLMGRPIPARIIGGVQGVFMLLFMSFMLYILFFGFWRWAGDSELDSLETSQSEYYIDNSSQFKK